MRPEPTLQQIKKVLSDEGENLLEHMQKKPEPGCQQREAHLLFHEVATYVQLHGSQVFTSSYPPAMYNIIRNRLEALKRMSDSFADYELAHEHELCQFLQKFLPDYQELNDFFKDRMRAARHELVKLDPDISQEQLIAWLLDYLKREAWAVRLEGLWNKHLHELSAKAWSLTGRQEDSEDLMHETYCRALRYLKLSQTAHFPEETKFKAWCATIMHNISVDMRRISNPLLMGSAADEHLANLVDAEDIKDPVLPAEEERLKKLIEELSPEDQEVLDRHVFKGLSLREIARSKNIPLNTINARYKRLRPKIFARFSARYLRDYLDHNRASETRMRKVLAEFVPKGEPASSPNTTNIASDTPQVSEKTEFVRLVLSLHVSGTDPRTIAAITAAISKPEDMDSHTKVIQDCLDKNLPHLFSDFYRIN